MRRDVLAVRGLVAPAAVGPIDFAVRAGEILGFAGLEGSGIDEIFHVLFGLGKPSRRRGDLPAAAAAGQVPLQAIKQGFALVPANRRDEGLMTDWSIRRNTTLVVLDRLLEWLGIHRPASAQRRVARAIMSRALNVATDSIDKRVNNLCGGNQQKVVVAKWLATGPTVLILNDPTRGVDVGAKSEIYALCDQLAAKGWRCSSPRRRSRRRLASATACLSSTGGGGQGIRARRGDQSGRDAVDHRRDG